MTIKYNSLKFNFTFKFEAKLIVKYLKKAVKSALKKNEWLDQITYNKSIEKLDSIIENIGYPDWIKDSQQLDKFYNLV